MEKKQISVFLSLAKTLVYDLGLNKVVIQRFCPSIQSEMVTGRSAAPKENTMQERRAALACFCLTSQ